MTSTEKLLKKEFGIKSEQELMQLINSKNEKFFKTNLFLEKEIYLKKISSLINKINCDGSIYADIAAMAKDGSMFSGTETTMAFGSIKTNYQTNRKALVNHVKFF